MTEKKVRHKSNGHFNVSLNHALLLMSHNLHTFPPAYYICIFMCAYTHMMQFLAWSDVQFNYIVFQKTEHVYNSRALSG